MPRSGGIVRVVYRETFEIKYEVLQGDHWLLYSYVSEVMRRFIYFKPTA